MKIKVRANGKVLAVVDIDWVDELEHIISRDEVKATFKDFFQGARVAGATIIEAASDAERDTDEAIYDAVDAYDMDHPPVYDFVD